MEDSEILHKKIDQLTNQNLILQKQMVQLINQVSQMQKSFTQLLTGSVSTQANVNSINGSNVFLSSAMFKLAGDETAKYIIEKMPTAIVKNSHLDLLTYALSQVAVDGLFLEFGVYSGTTINHISSVKRDKKVYGFDSFEGLPEDWRSGYHKGAFARNSLPTVNANVELVKGVFNETLPLFVEEHKEKCAFIHIDCDLYSSTKCVFEYLGNSIVEGTVIVFDEYFNYPGWQQGEFKAFQEFVATNGVSYSYIGYNQRHEQCAVRITKK